MCLGQVYEQCRHFDKAAVAYKNVLTLEPESTKAIEALDKLKQLGGSDGRQVA
jgi:cytochrome c-type biogenesis protein CcmH/NrfG